MNIAIIGSGYVGTTAAALLALSGHTVKALDVDKHKVEAINNSTAPFYEEGLDEILSKAIQKGSLTATIDYEAAISDADFIFSCVGTPDRPDGSSDLQFVFKAAETAAKYLKPGAIYIQKSTVPVGTGRRVMKVLPKNISYVSNPEFLREGTAIYDSLMFDRIVVGGDDPDSIKKVLSLHKTVENNAVKISKIAGLEISDELKDQKGHYIGTQLESAELIKVTSNAFLALKISFANSIAKLSDATGADITEVMDAVGADRRIGRAFLNAGRGYGGGCFPKDVSGLISSAAEFGVDMPIMTAATEVNESMPGYIASRAEEILGGSLQNKKVAVLGLSFKAGTSDARKSPGVKLANLLDKAGAQVSAYDPHANGEARKELRDGVSIANNALEAMKDSNAVFIATAWPEFKDINFAHVKVIMQGDLVYDADNCLNFAALKDTGLRFVAVGRNS